MKINISSAAKNYFIQLLKKKSKDTHIMVYVKNPGTERANCRISYCNIKEISQSSFQVSCKEFFIFIDKKSVFYLRDLKIDLVIDNIGSHLVFQAPFIKMNKIEKKDSLINKVHIFLEEEINPFLMRHGGRVTLIKITENCNIMLKFSGGCNGCRMVSVTLKSNIENRIKLAFPEIKKIVDVTDHKVNPYSYYT